MVAGSQDGRWLHPLHVSRLIQLFHVFTYFFFSITLKLIILTILVLKKLGFLCTNSAAEGGFGGKMKRQPCLWPRTFTVFGLRNH